MCISMEKHKAAFSFFRLVFFTVYCGVMLEVVFQLSRDSFATRLKPLELLFVIVNSMVFFMLPVLAAAAGAVLFPAVFGGGSALSGVFRKTCMFAVSTVMVFVAYAHVDTLVYTFFGKNTADLPRTANLPVLAVLIVAAWILSRRKVPALAGRLDANARLFSVVLFCFFAVTLASSAYYVKGKFPHMGAGALKAVGKPLPDIIMFSSDSLEVNHLGVYGYGRQTTPNVSGFTKQATIYTRAYTNSGNTRGSIASILTGMYPATTKVFLAPDILLGEHAFEHLPGMLADMGYFGLSIGDGFQFSPERMNMRMGFHRTNGKDTGIMGTSRFALGFMRLFNTEIYFMKTVADRIVSRPMYMVGFTKRLTVFKSLKATMYDIGPIPGYAEEDRRFDDALKYVSMTDRPPVFAFIHMLRTHGPVYNGLRFNRFSGGRRQDKAGPNLDHYDDAILTIDHYFGRLVASLKQAGRYEGAMVFFLTDHGLIAKNTRPLPLIIKHPGQTVARTVHSPVEFVDIAPSILVELGVSPPGWMEGRPVLASGAKDFKKSPLRSFRGKEQIHEDGTITRKLGPPLHGLGSMYMLHAGLLAHWDISGRSSRLLDVSVDPLSPAPVEDINKRLPYLKDMAVFLIERGYGVQGAFKASLVNAVEEGVGRRDLKAR